MAQYRNRFVRRINYTHPILGRTLYRLVNLISGDEIKPYATFLTERTRTENSSARSINAWADDLSNFFNYYVVASELASSNPNLFLGSPLSDITFAYPHYLIDGSDSSNLIAKQVAKKTGFTKSKRSTALRRLSTLKTFLTFSVGHQHTQLALKNMGLIDTDVSPKIFAVDFQTVGQTDSKFVSSTYIGSNPLWDTILKLLALSLGSFRLLN